MATEPVKIGRAEALAEAYKRGLLPPEMKSAYEEAQKRGLVGAAPAAQTEPTQKPTLAPFASPNPVAIAMENAQRQVAGATMPARARQDGWKPDQWAAAQRAQRGSQDANDKMMLSSWESYNRELPKSYTQPMPSESLIFEPQRKREAEDLARSEIDKRNAVSAPAAPPAPTNTAPRPATPDLRNVNRAPQTTGPDYTNYGPGAAVGGADIGKGLKNLPQHAANAVIGAAEATANLPADLINSSRQANANMVVDDRMAMMNANRMPQLQDRVGAPKPSTPAPMLPTFNAPRIPIAEQDASVTGALIEGLGQFIVGRVGIDKLAKGGGLIPGLAKDLTTTGVAFQSNSGRVADMIDPAAIPEGPLRDFATWLRTQPEDSPIMGRLKNMVEDALATGPALVPQTAVRGAQAVGNAINDAVNPQMAPTSAGAARPGPINTATLEPRAPSAAPQPPQTPANALASPPAPAQAASASQPSVVPQPTVSQAGAPGTGQQAGAGVGAGGGGAVPPAGPATLQATPTVAPVAPSAIAKSDRQIIGRLLKAGGVPGNDVDNVLAGMVEAFNRTNSPNSRLLLFAEDYLPTVLPKQVADDVKQQLRGFLYERTSRGGKAGDQSRAIALSNIEQIRGSQKGRLTDVIENKLGDTSLKTTRGKIRGDKSLNAEAVYKQQIDATEAAIDAKTATQKQIDARELLKKKMAEPSYFDRIPQEIKERAANDGIDLADAIKSNPLEIAHWLQSRLGFLERKKLDPNAGFYHELRVGLLRPLEDAVNGYRGARMRHGDLVGQEIATKFGNNLITNAAKVDAVDEMADAYKRLAPSQREVAKRSMRDALLNEFRRGRAATAVDPVTGARVDNQAAKITRLQTAGVIDALPRILGKDGEDIADEIMAISRENERLAPYGSDTETNFAKVEAAQDAVRSPVNKAAGAFDDNNSLVRTVIYDALLMAAHMPPVATLAKGGSWVAGKLGSPSAKKLASATETLIGRPPAGSANALASPPPRAPRNPSGPRTPIPRPPVTQELLDDLLNQYSALNHARAPKKSEELAKRIVRVRAQLEKQTTDVVSPAPVSAPPANAFNAEPQAAAQAAPGGNAFNGKRALRGETSNASPAVTGALIGGTAGYVASDGDPTATLAGAGLGGLAGNRLAKFGGGRKPPTPPTPPKPPVPKAPVAFKRDPAMANLSPGDMVGYIEAKYPPAAPNLQPPYFTAANAIKRANGDRAAATKELADYATYLKQSNSAPEVIENAERTVRAVADVDPIFFDDAAFNASMKGRIEAGGTAAMEQGAKPAATSAPSSVTPLKPAPKPPTRQGFGSSKLPMDEGAKTWQRQQWQAEKGPVDDKVWFHWGASFDAIDPAKNQLGLHVGSKRAAWDRRKHKAILPSQEKEQLSELVTRGDFAQAPDMDQWTAADYVDSRAYEAGLSPDARWFDNRFPDLWNELDAVAKSNPTQEKWAEAVRDATTKRGLSGWQYSNTVEDINQPSRIIMDPTAARRTDAKFDPAESGSSKLLAGMGESKSRAVMDNLKQDVALAGFGSVGGSVSDQENPQQGAALGMGLALGGKYGGRALGAFGRGANKLARGVDQAGFGSGRPKPPPANRLSGGQKPPARSSTASRMVAGGVIGGIAGSAGSADPQDMAIDTQMSETKAQMAAAQQSMRDLQAILDIYDKGTPQQVQEAVGRGGKYTKPDGVIGPDTSAKVDADRKRIAAEMKAYTAQMDKGRARLKDLEEQQAYAKTKPSAQQQIFRELGPLVGALVGVGLGAKLRGGAVKKYAAEVPNKIAKANALLTPGPLNKSRSVAAQAALRQQPSNINEFWIQGGAKDKVPFELSAKGKPIPRKKSDVMPPSKLFPTPRFRSMDIGVIAGSLVESGAAQLYAMQLESQIKDARQLAEDKPTEANLAHVQALEDQHAVVQALSRLGAGIAAGRAVGALKMPYPSARANVPAADAERALLLEHFRKVK